jgi:hypothetical protein
MIWMVPIATFYWVSFTAFNEQLAILLRGAKTSEEKLNHAVHFDGVGFTSQILMFVYRRFKTADFKILKTVGKF